MLDKLLRAPKKTLLLPAAHQLKHIHPSKLTVLGLGMGLISAVTAGYGYYAVAFGFWLVNRVIDGLDGEIARLANKQSDLGAYLDLLADLIIYALIPLALVLSNPSQIAWLSLALLLMSFYINAGSWMILSAILEKRGHGAKTQGEKTSITMPTGLIEGTETIIFYSLFLLFPAYLSALFGLMSSLIILTIVQRFRWAYKHL